MLKPFPRIVYLMLALLLFSTLCSCSNSKGISDAQDAQDDTDATVTDSFDDTQEQAAPSQSASADEESYKRVAFTFDDGPHDEISKKVVDLLSSYDGHATFFVVGDRVNEKSAEIIKYALSHGNEIGMHSFTHTKMFNSCDDETYARELKYTHNRLSSYAGVNATLLRPPGGLISPERIEASEYPIILWSVDSLDWTHKKATSEQEAAQNIQAIVDNVLSSVKDGDIILMHDIYENTYLAFRIIIEQLHKDGYTFVTVSELLGDSIRSGAKFHSVTLN